MFRIGHLSTFYHTSILFLTKKEFMERLGVELRWRLFGTGPAIIDAFDKREIDLAYLGLTPAITGIERGIPIKCIAGGHVEGTVICGLNSLKAYPEIDLKEFFLQFRGKVIGVPAKGSIHDVIIRGYLEESGILHMVEIKNFQWADQIIEAMKKGEVSIAAGTPNLAIAVKRFLGGRILWPPDRLWPYSPSYGILIRTDGPHDDKFIREFIGLHEELCNLLREKPLEASELIASLVGVVDADFIYEAIQLSPRYCASLPEEYISSTLGLMKVMKRLGYINREFSRDEIFDERFIRELHQEKSHY